MVYFSGIIEYSCHIGVHQLQRSHESFVPNGCSQRWNSENIYQHKGSGTYFLLILKVRWRKKFTAPVVPPPPLAPVAAKFWFGAMLREATLPWSRSVDSNTSWRGWLVACMVRRSGVMRENITAPGRAGLPPAAAKLLLPEAFTKGPKARLCGPAAELLFTLNQSKYGINKSEHTRVWVRCGYWNKN